jgi:3-deoxy-manno-octulosonate cytidylyltransferase (CMP-KDO synthetase)
MFHIIIPARLASSRLPNKVLLDLGGAPMVVRTAQQALKAGAVSVTVALDDDSIAHAISRYDLAWLKTDVHHATGTDRLAQAAALLNFPDDAVVVNVQADEPFIDPVLIQTIAKTLQQQPDCAIATAAHPLDTSNALEMFNPNVVKVVCNAASQALYFSRAPIPFARDRVISTDQGLMQAAYRSDALASAMPVVLRHIGIYAYRVSFLRQYPHLAQSPLEIIEKLEQLRALWHGYRIAVLPWGKPMPAGVDTAADLATARQRWAAS